MKQYFIFMYGLSCEAPRIALPWPPIEGNG